MWIHVESEEWDLICDYAEIDEKAGKKAFTHDVFGKATRLSGNIIIERCDKLGIAGTYDREEMRRAMNLADGYEIGTADRWRAEWKAIRYSPPLDQTRLSDEKQIPVNKPHRKTAHGLWVWEQWKGSKIRYGDVAWVLDDDRKKTPMYGGAVYDRSIDTDENGKKTIILWYVGSESNRRAAECGGQTEDLVTLIRRATPASTALADAWIAQKRKDANRLSQSNDVKP